MNEQNEPRLNEREYARRIRREAKRVMAGEHAPRLDRYVENDAVRVPERPQERALLAGMFLASGSRERALEALSVPGFTPDSEWHGKDALIIDPGFVRLDGHHANANEYFRRLLVRLGFDAAVLRNARSEGGASMGEEHGYRVFTPSPYQQPFGKLPTVEQLSWINDLFFMDFLRTLSHSRPALMVAHTLRFTFVEGFCRYLAEHYRNRELMLVLGAVETDALDETQALNEPVRETYRRAIAHLRSLGAARILFIVERPELRRLIRSAGGDGFDIVESPFVGAGLVTRRRSKRWFTRRLLLGFVGQSRIERGITLLPEVIERTLDGFPDCRWVVQIDKTLLINLGKEPVLERFEALAKHPRVELLPPGVATEEYQRLLSRIDILVLPYGERYRYSGSGIAAEGIRAGHVQIVPKDSSMEAAIEQSGGEPVTFSSQDPSAITQAVAQAVQRFRSLSRTNRLAAARLEKDSGLTRAISAMVAETPKD